MKGKKPLREAIYDRLLDDIVNGRINPGQKLLEVELAKQFRVSRTPVREAIIQLEKEGFIFHKKNTGALVRNISLKEISETFEIIALLEAFAVEKVVQIGLSLEDRSKMLLFVEEMEEESKERKYKEYMKSNIEYHKFFNERCGSQTLLKVIVELRRKVHRLIFWGATVPKYLDCYLISHRKICDAIQAGNPVAAGAAMKAHVEEHKNFVLDEMSGMFSYI